MSRISIISCRTIIILSMILLSGRVLSPVRAQITGLDDWTIFIDQGHAQKENMGLYGYSEAEKVLRVGLALRQMFVEQTDIKAVYVARETDQDNISLEGRVDLANNLGVDFYYSIHSDAGAPQSNSTLMLYGGWKSNGALVEKSPQGGRAFGEILDWDLTGAMRIGRRENYADRDFYLQNQFHHTNQFPYLYVNRVSNMASLLSEAGFHTNPGQQQLNMNAEWKVLEALSAFRSLLQWHDLDRPAIGVATGIIKDIETGKPLNGITVTIGDKTYTTDSYESLFYKYSVNPDQLSNGFYFIPGLEPMSTVNVVFESDMYQTLETELLIKSDPNTRTGDNLSFLDVEMVSVSPPTVMSVEPAAQLGNLVPGTPLLITFSRKMDRESVEQAIGITPEAILSFTWNNDFTVSVNTSGLDYLTGFEISIDGSIAKNMLTGQFLDGDGDGSEGGNFVFAITTSDEDTEAPILIDYSPNEYEPTTEKRPAIRLVYHEEIITGSIQPDAVQLMARGSGAQVDGTLHHIVINGQSVLHFFPTQDLLSGMIYRVEVKEGLSDNFNNLTEATAFEFVVLDQPITQLTVIDNFNGGLTGWWNPQQAGQTLGIITELTSRTHNADVVNRAVGSTGSMKLSYAWDMDYVGTPYIRQHIPATATQNGIRFNHGDILQVYIFGDGSGNEIRMMILDGLNQLEAHQWVKIDWIGWKLISWDLSNDPAFGWVRGNGILEGGNFYMDGFHLRYANGARDAGAVYFDYLHFVKRQEINYPTTLYENFQDYDDFTTNIFPWITRDVKDDITWNPQGFTFPGSGQPYAFKVLNPAETTPPVIDNHPPVEGDKYLIAMMSQSQDENKWLISPQIRITSMSELSFYAKSIEVATYGPERIRVLIAEDDSAVFEFNPDAFNLISDGDYIEVPAQWTGYSWFLGGMEGKVVRFAIQYVSHDDYMIMLDKIVVDEAPTYTLSLKAQPQEWGQVNGAGEYAQNQQVQILATPAAGNAFVNWTDEDENIISTQANYIFLMPGAALSLTAHFETATYNLILRVEPEGSGSVEGAGTYFYQDEVTASAVAAQDYRFMKWTNRDGDIFSTDEEYVFAMPAYHHELFAHFEFKTGLIDMLPGGLKIYPNPVKDNIQIMGEEIITLLRITDLAGREVYARKPGERHFSADVSLLDSGLYILQVITESNAIINRKIQIIR